MSEPESTPSPSAANPEPATSEPATAPATSAGTTTAAGEGVGDEQLAQQVAEQTSSDLQVGQVFENEADSTYSDTEAQKAEADELGG